MWRFGDIWYVVELWKKCANYFFETMEPFPLCGMTPCDFMCSSYFAQVVPQFVSHSLKKSSLHFLGCFQPDPKRFPQKANLFFLKAQPGITLLKWARIPGPSSASRPYFCTQNRLDLFLFTFWDVSSKDFWDMSSWKSGKPIFFWLSPI